VATIRLPPLTTRYSCRGTRINEAFFICRFSEAGEGNLSGCMLRRCKKVSSRPFSSASRVTFPVTIRRVSIIICQFESHRPYYCLSQNSAVCSEKMDSKGFVFSEYPYPPSLIFSLNGTTFSDFEQQRTEHQRDNLLLLPFDQVKEVRKFPPEVLTNREEIILISASTVATFRSRMEDPQLQCISFVEDYDHDVWEPSARSFSTLKSQLSPKI